MNDTGKIIRTLPVVALGCFYAVIDQHTAAAICYAIIMWMLYKD
jgi:hypothetical protein